MFKEYLNEVRTNVLGGIMLLAKTSMKQQLLIAIIFQSISLIFSLFVFKTDELNRLMMYLQKGKIDNPQEILDMLPENFGLIAFGFIILSFIVSSIQYATSLSINDQIIRNNNFNFGDAFKSNFGSKLIQLLLNYLLTILFATLLMIAAIIIVGLLFSISKIIGVLIAFFIFIALLIGVFRLSAGFSFVMHGNQNAFEALKSSIKTITWMRALILFVGMIVVAIVFGIAGLILGLIFSSFASENPMVSQILNAIIGVALYPFLIAALSSVYFRYNEVEESYKIDEHLIN